MFMSSREAAEMLGIAEGTLRKSRLADGELLGVEPPPYRKLGRKKVVYEAEVLAAWIERHFPRHDS